MNFGPIPAFYRKGLSLRTAPCRQAGNTIFLHEKGRRLHAKGSNDISKMGGGR